MAIEEDALEIVMSLIVQGGNAKSNAMEAIQAAKNHDFEEAHSKIAEADDALKMAHQAQSSLLSKEAQGDSIQFSLLLTHGQDHIMNALTTRDLAIEIVDLHRKLANQ